jgi:hypothetical protein
MQRFAGVDVAEAGDDALIEQRDFQRHTFAGACRRQCRRIERGGQRFGTERREPARRLPCLGSDDIHHAEPPRIIEDDRRAVGQFEDDVIVPAGALVRPLVARPPRRTHHTEGAGHAEMHQQGLARAQRDEQVLAAAFDSPNPAPFDPLPEILWKRTTQIGSPQQYAIDRCTAHRPLELAADGFDFGKLRHVLPLSMTSGGAGVAAVERMTRMVQLIHEHHARIHTPERVEYVPRTYALERPDGVWEAWLEFLPVDDAQAPTPRTARETTQMSRDAVVYWTSGLEPAYFEGAFARAAIVTRS